MISGRIRYISVKAKANRPLLVIFILLLFLTTRLSGQGYKINFRNTSLADALVQVTKSFGVRINFDAERLGRVSVTKDISVNTIEELLASLLNGSGYGYRLRNNHYLIIPSPAGNAEEPRECQVIGSIADKETGELLPFATVIFYDQNLMLSATENGSFCLKNVNTNPFHLMVSYLGYYPKDTTVSWNASTMNFDLKLKRKINMLDSIVVSSDRLEMVDLRNDVDFATTIDPARMIDLPVTAETDVFRMLQLLPGINYNENSAGLNIRGGTGDQNLVLFDGQTLYNLSHYYGVVSSINPNIIKDLQVYKGGYDSRFGERVSGIIDITSKSGSQTKPTVYGDVNLLSANIAAEIPVTRKLTLVAAGRRSYSDIYSTAFSDNLFQRKMDQFKADSGRVVVQSKPSFYFYDYNAKLTWRRNNLESFSLSLYGGKDDFANTYSGNSRSFIIDATDKNIWSNYGISATWQKQWNESLFSNVQAGASGYSNTASNTTLIDRTLAKQGNHNALPEPQNGFDSYSSNDLKDLYFTVRNNYRFSNWNQLNFGILIRENSINYYKDAGSKYVYDNIDQSAVTSSAYLQDRISLTKNFTLKPGIRFSYYGGTGVIYSEPRFSANYRFSDAFSVRVATGKYYQFISQVLAQQETGYNKNFWMLTDKSTHPEVESNHFIAGFTGEKGRFLLDAEGYIKTFSGLQEYIYVSQFLKNSDFNRYFPPPGTEPAASASYFVTGTGRSYGVDLMLRYKGTRFTSWLSYAYGRSYQRYPQINFNNRIPSPADLPNQLSWTNLFTAGKWNFGSITLFSSGKPYIDFAESSSTAPLVRVYKRLPDYFRTDLSANYNFSIRKVKLKAGITFINIFNTQNYFDVNTRKFDFENTSFSETSLILSQSFSVNTFLHFVF